MKKTLVMSILGIGSLIYGQSVSQTAQENGMFKKNNFYVGIGTQSQTGLGFSSVEGVEGVSWNAGVQGGYFLVDKLALVAGGSINHYGKDVDVFSYLGGVKYYIESKVPVQVDLNGNDHGANFLGTQVGYAFAASERFTIEPRVKYNINLDSYGRNVLSGGFEVNYFFK